MTRSADIERVPLWRALLPAIVVCALFFSVAAYLYRASYPLGATRIDTVEARPSTLPVSWLRWSDEDPLGWQTYRLPARICEIRCKTPYTAWRYRFRWDPARLADPAVYFPQASTNAAFYLNGALVELKGRMTYPPSAYRYEPRLIRLPDALLKPGMNELTWRLTIEHRGIGGVANAYLGEYVQMEAAQRSLRLLTRDMILAAFWLQIVALVFSAGLALRVPAEPIIRWFLLVAPFWLFISAWHLFPDLIGPARVRYALFFTAMFGIIAFSSTFVLSISHPPPRWIVRIAVLYALLGGMLAVLAYAWPGLEAPVRYGLPNRVIRYTAILILPFIIVLLFRHLNRHREQPLARGAFAAALFSGACGAHDVVVGAMGPGPMLYSLTPLAGIGIAIAFLLEIGRRVLASQRMLALYNERLQITVAEKEAELRTNYERLHKADIERSLADERARIMRDMHDGVGGQLAALVHLSSDAGMGRSEIVAAIRAGLADLRLVLDSLNQAEHDLLISLAGFRERLQSLLSGSGIQLRWRQAPELAGKGLGPEATLQLYRILQEAFSNAIRHSNARNIGFDVELDDVRLQLSISDDGVGFDPQQPLPQGHYGLKGMRHRAERLGGAIKVVTSPGRGTTLHVILPVDALR